MATFMHFISHIVVYGCEGVEVPILGSVYELILKFPMAEI